MLRAKGRPYRWKVSNHAKLFEMTQPGHIGIDHVWHDTRLPHGYRISDTKGSGQPFHRKLETAQTVWQALEYGIDAYLGEEDEKKVGGAVNHKVTRHGKQLSHMWVAEKIKTANLTSQAAIDLLPKIRAWEFADFRLGEQTTFESGQAKRSLVKCPYDRSLITVVGPNHNKHEKAPGSMQGKCKKTAVSHQIGTEFVIPNTLLLK